MNYRFLKYFSLFSVITCKFSYLDYVSANSTYKNNFEGLDVKWAKNSIFLKLNAGNELLGLY